MKNHLAAVSVVVLSSTGCGPDVRSFDRGDVTIHQIAMTIANAWVIDAQSGGTLVVDIGGKNEADDLLAGLDAVRVDKAAVDLVVITHGHMDHLGCGKALQAQLQAPIAVGAADAKLASDGDSPLAPTQNTEGALLGPFLDLSFPKFTPDVLLGDRLRLDAYGIAGEVVAVPGHTAGSVAVVLDSGDAFVGDLVRGVGEGDRGAHEGRCETHFFSNDFNADRDHMEALLARGVTSFFPGHGPMFDAATVRGWLEDSSGHADDERARLAADAQP